MTEYYTRKRIDNSRLARPAEPHRVREFCKRAAVGGVLALCAMGYAWQHFECIQMRYVLEQLQVKKAQATELNQRLRLEATSLGSPTRIDAIAREQLGLTVPSASQVATVQGSSEGVVAQVGPQLQTPRP
jgi:cell division protein FtsL